MDQRDTCGGSKKKKSGSEKVAEMGQIKIILIQIWLRKYKFARDRFEIKWYMWDIPYLIGFSCENLPDKSRGL